MKCFETVKKDKTTRTVDNIQNIGWNFWNFQKIKLGFHWNYGTLFVFFAGLWIRIDLKGVWHEIFDFRFFHESVSPRPRRIPLGPFWIFLKIRGGSRELIFIAGVNDTGDKLFSGVNDTSEKFIAGVINLCHGEINKKPKNFRQCQQHRWKTVHQCRRHRR